MTLFYKIGRAILIPIYKIFYFYEVKYEQELPDDQPYILCPNHMQYKDALLIMISHKKQIYFMAKHELFRHRILAKILYAAGAFPVKRGTESKTAVKHSKNLLNSGKIVGIFMEGTRSKSGKLLAPKAGAVLLAQQCNAAIVPVSISCKNEKLPKIFRKITIHYGKPLSLKELGIEDGSRSGIRDASRIVMDNIKKLRQEDI